MGGNPQPYRLLEPLDMEDARAAYKLSARQRHEALEQLEAAIEKLAGKERDYRRAKATAYVTVEAATAGERDSKVADMAATARYERDVQKGMVDVAKQRLEEIDANRQSLNRLVEWSTRIDPYGQQHEQPRPRAVA